MTYKIRMLATALVLACSSGTSFAEEHEGQKVAFDRKKGNCLACHFVQGAPLTGTTGPALIAMKARFPKREDLLSQVSDARLKNAGTIMPPFGAHGILSNKELNLVVDWLYTL